MFLMQVHGFPPLPAQGQALRGNDEAVGCRLMDSRLRGNDEVAGCGFLIFRHSRANGNPGIFTHPIRVLGR